MNTKEIVFSSRQVDFMRELRERVSAYFEHNHISESGNARIVVKSLFMLALYVVPYVLMLTGMLVTPSGILAAWFIMGFGMAGLGMVVMHDANHGSYTASRHLNKWLGKTLYLLGGYPPTWRHQHNRMHHGFTNIDGFDEDIGPVEILRFSPHKRRRKIHRFQHLYAWFFYGLMTLSWVIMKDYKQLSGYRKQGVSLTSRNNYTLLFLDLISAKIVYYLLMLVLPVLLLPVPWYIPVLGFVIMHFVSGLVLGTIFQTAHVVPTSEYPLPDEEGNLEHNWAVHQLSTTSDFARKNKVLSWLIGGLNFQVEHHLFPNISHVHYPRIAPIVEETARKYDLPYSVQPTFGKAVAAHFRMLRALGRKAEVTR
mgnify:CR=1 FL=1